MHDQLNPNSPIGDGELPSPEYYMDSMVSVYPSSIAHYFAPSNDSGVGGMYRKHIRATTSWRNGAPRHDCVLVQKDAQLPGMKGLHAARVRLFIGFYFRGKRYPCALVQWFSEVDNAPDHDTGMWIVEPDFNDDGSCFTTVIHIDTVMREAHLIPVYGPDFIPLNVTSANSLDTFRCYYVNKFADYHAHRTIF